MGGALPAGLSANVASQVLSASIVALVVSPLLLQSPPHPEKDELGSGSAVSVTSVPSEYDSVQSTPQLMPTGSLNTVPVPSPVLLTVNV